MAERKRDRRAHLNDFRLDLNGDYVYGGAQYRYEGAEPFRAAAKRLALAAGLMAAAIIGTGCVEAPAMLGCFYVLLPFIGEFVCAILAVWSLGLMIRHGDVIRAYVYRRSVERLTPCLYLTVGFAGAGVLANLVFVLIHGFLGKTAAVLALFALKAVVLVSALYLLRRSRAMVWRCTDVDDPFGE